MRCVTRPFADTDRITCMEDPFSTAFGVRLPRVCGEMLEAPHDPTSGRAADRLSRQLVPELRQPRHLLPRRSESFLAQSVRPVPVGVFELLSLRGGASGPSWYRSVTSTASPGCNSASSFATIRTTLEFEDGNLADLTCGVGGAEVDVGEDTLPCEVPPK
jgi:hypothetical protein